VWTVRLLAWPLYPVPPQREPPAAMRQMVAQFRSMYVALVQEGFTPVEAVTLIGDVRGG